MIETPTTSRDWSIAAPSMVFPQADRRTAPRRRVMWRAEAAGVPCGVRDLNDNGAQIYLPSPQTLSGSVVLSIRHRRADYPADIVWRSGFAAGLRFLGSSRLN